MAERKLETKKYENDQGKLGAGPPEKKLEKVVTGKVRKKSEMRKFADVFISEDVTNVKSYILMDILIPTIKNTISEVVKNSIDILLFGETGRSERRSAASKVSYSRFYNERSDQRDYSTRRLGNGLDYDEIVYANRGEAEAVLSTLQDALDQFGVVTVGDLYDVSEISTTNHAVNKYGWTDLRSAEPIRLRTGEYVLKLPKALPI